MIGVYLFWAWVMVSSLAVCLAGRCRLRRWLSRLYRPLLLVAFSLVTLSVAARYLETASRGHTDAAIGVWYLQALINPGVRMIAETEPFAPFLYGPIADLYLGEGEGRIVASVSFVAWEVMVEDLFLGTLFWLGVGTLWLRFVRRRTRPTEEPRET